MLLTTVSVFKRSFPTFLFTIGEFNLYLKISSSKSRIFFSFWSFSSENNFLSKSNWNCKNENINEIENDKKKGKYFEKGFEIRTRRRSFK